ncbi:MAG: glycerol kinase GlpK [Mangrovibacterium sp.]|nr:glycerol kinase GlpK [Mangrovibacterium sp.]
MKKKYVLALDQGTTSSRAILFSGEGNIISVAQKEFRQFYPNLGWVEHDASEIWQTQVLVATDAISKAGIHPGEVACIGITNQRETTVVWDRETGKPVCPAIVWQDRRTAAFCDELNDQGYGESIYSKTGLIIDSYFSGTKIKWILDHVPGARERAEQGKLAFGTIDSWLLWNFTEGAVHVTDVSNASRTMLFNIHTLEWDSELLQLFDIPASVLPEVRSSSEIYGVTRQFDVEIPISGIAGDQQAATFGQCCTKPGMVKNTYGTGCFILANTGNKPVRSKNKLLTTIAWKINNETVYALEGSIFVGGAIVQWLRDGLGIIKSSAEIERLARSVPDNGGVYLVSALTGLGAPHWDPHARGMIIGLTRGTTSGHICRAALEGIAFQTRDVLKAMEADAGVQVSELRVDGGAAANDFLMQFQSDILQRTVVRPKVLETTALGAAYLAGLAVGFWDSIDEICNRQETEQKFWPGLSAGEAAGMVVRWQEALKRSMKWDVFE